MSSSGTKKYEINYTKIWQRNVCIKFDNNKNKNSRKQIWVQIGLITVGYFTFNIIHKFTRIVKIDVFLELFIIDQNDILQTVSASTVV